VQIARERLAEAKANHQSAVSQFFRGFRRVSRTASTMTRFRMSRATSLCSQVFLRARSNRRCAARPGRRDLQSLAAKQLAKAADHALEAQRQDSVFGAAQGYFDLALAQGSVGVANEAVRISGDYETQLASAVETGVALKAICCAPAFRRSAIAWRCGNRRNSSASPRATCPGAAS